MMLRQMWHEALEEASRLYFADHNVPGRPPYLLRASYAMSGTHVQRVVQHCGTDLAYGATGSGLGAYNPRTANYLRYSAFVPGMLAVLKPMHDLMHKGPET
eukprot:426412-Rhodomonas_salina.5